MSLCKVKISVLALAIAASPLSLGSTGVASPVGALFDSSDRSWEQSVRTLSPTEMSQTQGDGLPLLGLIVAVASADIAAVAMLFGYYNQAKALEESNQKQEDKQDPNDKRSVHSAASCLCNQRRKHQHFSLITYNISPVIYSRCKLTFISCDYRVYYRKEMA